MTTSALKNQEYVVFIMYMIDLSIIIIFTQSCI